MVDLQGLGILLESQLSLPVLGSTQDPRRVGLHQGLLFTHFVYTVDSPYSTGIAIGCAGVSHYCWYLYLKGQLSLLRTLSYKIADHTTGLSMGGGGALFTYLIR